MELKVFCFENSEHISGARKQNDRDHEISRHGSNPGPIESRHGVTLSRSKHNSHCCRMSGPVVLLHTTSSAA
jgi:hypothetical protein